MKSKRSRNKKKTETQKLNSETSSDASGENSNQGMVRTEKNLVKLFILSIFILSVLPVNIPQVLALSANGRNIFISELLSLCMFCWIYDSQEDTKGYMYNHIKMIYMRKISIVNVDMKSVRWIKWWIMHKRIITIHQMVNDKLFPCAKGIITKQSSFRSNLTT